MDYVVEVGANLRLLSSLVSNDVLMFDCFDFDLSILHVDAACRFDCLRVGFGGVIGSTSGCVKAFMFGFRDLSLGLTCAKALAILEG